MAVQPVFEFDVPAPYDTYFNAGEKALAVADPIDSADGRTNYHLAVWTNLEGGEYLIRILAVNASSWATSISKNNYRVIFNTKRDSGPQEQLISLPRGRQRIDLIVSNLSTTPDLCYIAFSLWRQGRLVYSTNANGWVFNTSVIEDAEIPALPDIRTFLPVFNLTPNWGPGIIERLSYSTEILSSESDTEQRRSLRLKPRRTFEIQYLREWDRRTRIDSFFAGTGTNQVLLPMWHDQQPLTAAFGSSLVFASGTLDEREFRAGMWCMLTAKNPNVFEIVIIDTHDLDTDTITFVASPLATWGLGSLLVPLRVARILEAAQLTNPTDAVGQSVMRFQLDDAEPTWFEPSWNRVGAPLFSFRIDRATDLDDTFDRPTSHIIDNEFGPLEVYDSQQKGRVVIHGGLTSFRRSDVLGYRQFIDMARGRAVRFWIASYESDFTLADDIGAHDYIDIRSIGFGAYFKSLQRFRLAIQIEYNDGTPTLFYRITDFVEIDEDTERIYLDEELTPAVQASVKRISYLSVVRFDQDIFEFTHLVDQSKAVQSSFVVKSTEDDGMDLPTPLGQPFQYTLTSLIYPIDVVESLDVAANMPSINVYNPVDTIDVTATLLALSMPVVVAYKTINSEPESIDVAATMLDLTLTTVIAYKTLTASVENFDVAATMLALHVEHVINYVELIDDPSDEGFNVTATLLGVHLA